MPAWVPMESAFDRATAQQAANANCVVHLYQDTLTPDGSTTEAQFDANEADFDDYAPITVAAWEAPILAPGQGFIITMPSQQFAQGATTPVTPNQIRGFYVKSAGGDMLYAARFASDVPVEVPHAGVPVELVDVFLTGFGA